jgi:hypothetical protein
MTTTNNKKMKQVLAAVDRNGRTWWTRCGVAFENVDGSWNIRLDLVPADLGRTTLQVRDFNRRDAENTGGGPVEPIVPAEPL